MAQYNLGGGSVFDTILSTITAADQRRQQNERDAMAMIQAGFENKQPQEEGTFSKIFSGGNFTPDDWTPGAHHEQVASSARTDATNTAQALMQKLGIISREEIAEKDRQTLVEEGAKNRAWETQERTGTQDYETTELDSIQDHDVTKYTAGFGHEQDLQRADLRQTNRHFYSGLNQDASQFTQGLEEDRAKRRQEDRLEKESAAALALENHRKNQPGPLDAEKMISAQEEVEKKYEELVNEAEDEHGGWLVSMWQTNGEQMDPDHPNFNRKMYNYVAERGIDPIAFGRWMSGYGPAAYYDNPKTPVELNRENTAAAAIAYNDSLKQQQDEVDEDIKKLVATDADVVTEEEEVLKALTTPTATSSRPRTNYEQTPLLQNKIKNIDSDWRRRRASARGAGGDAMEVRRKRTNTEGR
jgi:hypothetical protein